MEICIYCIFKYTACWDLNNISVYFLFFLFISLLIYFIILVFQEMLPWQLAKIK